MINVLLISDVHSNLPALEAVWSHVAARVGVDETWVLGDSVGYGAQPNEVVERVRELPSPVIVKGNHEAAALGEIPIYTFNEVAGQAALWTGSQLKSETERFLRSLPLTAQRHGTTLCHGSPRDPLWEYVTSASVAHANLDEFSTAGCALGHSHVPFVMGFDPTEDSSTVYVEDGHKTALDFRRWFINPGSVGQPRDGDPRASYAVLHVDESRDDSYPVAEFHRVEYDIELAQDRILEAGLPPPLAFRLSEGY